MKIDKKAAVFSQAAHEDIKQVRRYDQRPYFEHPARVAEIVRATGASAEIVAAAYLHDVVEDVPLESLIKLSIQYGANDTFSASWSEADPDSRTKKLGIISSLFGEYVARLVEQVTNVTKPADGDRAFRRQKELEHLSKACPEAQTIKLADLIDNSRDIKEHDPEFAKVYLKDKAELLTVLTSGHSLLFRRAQCDS